MKWSKRIENLLNIKYRGDSTTRISSKYNWDLTKIMAKNDLENIINQKTFKIKIKDARFEEDLKKWKSFLSFDDYKELKHELNSKPSKAFDILLEESFEEKKKVQMDNLEELIIQKVRRWRQIRNDIMRNSKERGQHNLFIGYGLLSSNTGKYSFYSTLLFKPVEIIIEKTNIFVQTINEEVIINKKILHFLKKDYKFEINSESNDKFTFANAFNSINELLKDIVEINLTKITKYDQVQREKQKNLNYQNSLFLGVFEPGGDKLFKATEKLLKEKSIDSILNINPLMQHKSKIQEKIKKENDAIIRYIPSNFSQDIAIRGAIEGDAFIFGPPGTGKTQTICNILANVLFEDKTALVLSSKPAALDVLSKRMGKLSAFQFYYHSSKRKEEFYKPIKRLVTQLIPLERTMKWKNFLTKGKYFTKDFFNNIDFIDFFKNESLESVLFLHQKNIVSKVKGANIKTHNLLKKLPIEVVNVDFHSILIWLETHMSKKTLTTKGKYFTKEFFKNIDLRKFVKRENLNSVFFLHEKNIMSKMTEEDKEAQNILKKIPKKVINDKSISVEEKLENNNFSKRRFLLFFKKWSAKHKTWIKTIKHFSANFNKEEILHLSKINDLNKTFEVIKNIKMFPKEIKWTKNLNQEEISHLCKINDLKKTFSMIKNIKTFSKGMKWSEKLWEKMKFANHNDFTEKDLKKILEKDEEQLFRAILWNISEKIKMLRKRGVIKENEYRSFIKAVQNGRLLPKTFLGQYKKIILTMFPVLVGTPNELSNIVVFDEDEYDYSIFDEASQMFLEDALAYLHIGKKSIIAGDNQQMQPTKWFQYRSDESEELEEDNEIISLLDFGLEKGLRGEERSYMLDKNYRSESSNIMKFSSKTFYNNELDTIDICNIDNAISNVEVVEVDGKWINNSNEEEAIKLLDDLIIYSDDDNYKTFILVTSNKPQMNNIKDKIYNIEKYSKLISLLENEDLLLKNIENIQGHEADLVLFSLAYDKSAGLWGTYVGRETGKNALNVAITRAKRKLVVYKSIHSSDVEKRTDSLKVFGDWLECIENMQKSETIILEEDYNKEFDSSFENDVYLELLNKMQTQIQCKIITQFNVGTFKIDIAILSSETNKFILGIEVDGYKYHEGYKKQLKDKERQMFLESKGYIIYRIPEYKWGYEKNKVINDINTIVKHRLNKSDNIESITSDDSIKTIGERSLELTSEEKILELKIEELDLSQRSFNALKRAGHEKIADLASLTLSQLSETKNFGKKSIEEVVEKLAELDLEIK